MRNMRKILAFILVLMLAFSTCMVAGVSAAEDTTTIYFEVPESWGDVSKIFCHIWPYGGDPLKNWQSKAEACTAVADTEGLYSYDIEKKTNTTLEEGVTYCVIFSADTAAQTYDVIMTTACLGDTLYVDPSITYENPQDSAKESVAAFWRNQDPTVYGPLKQVTSIGNVVGTALPEGVSDTDIFYDFLVTYLDNAREYSLKDDQTIIDDIQTALEMSDEDVDAVLTESGVEITWNGKEYGVVTSPDELSFILGDANLDGTVNVKDATVIQKFAADLVELTETENRAADANLDETVNVKDATAIQKYAAELEVDFPIGTTITYIPFG